MKVTFYADRRGFGGSQWINTMVRIELPVSANAPAAKEVRVRPVEFGDATRWPDEWREYQNGALAELKAKQVEDALRPPPESD